MKIRYLIAAGIAAATLGVAGCADEGYGHYYAGGGVGVSYDGFYDDYYGPFYDGYWGPGGDFYYSVGEGRPFVRDRAHHFRRDSREGFHAVHGHGTPMNHEEHR